MRSRRDIMKIARQFIAGFEEQTGDLCPVGTIDNSPAIYCRAIVVLRFLASLEMTIHFPQNDKREKK